MMKHFLKSKEGGVALEFAIVSPIFFALLFAIVEYSVFYYIQTTVGRLNLETSRLIRTGIAQNKTMSSSDFVDRYCDILGVFPDCAMRFSLDVAAFDSFADLAASTDRNRCEKTGDAGSDFDLGDEFQVVRVRVCYFYPILVPGLGVFLPRDSSGRAAIQKTRILRVEQITV